MRKQELHPRTAVINHGQKNKSKQTRLMALKWLAQMFPDAFDNNLRIRPLKKGIMADVLHNADKAAEEGVSKSKLREAVVLFTRRIDYLTCLKAQEMRVDLKGEPIGEVSTDDAERAALKIKKRVEKSARNAKKNMTGRQTPQYKPYSSGSDSHHAASTYSHKSAKTNNQSDDSFPIYPSRTTAYASQANTTSASRSATITVKHKTAKQYDPEAVARLKAKLGLSDKNGVKQETTD